MTLALSLAGSLYWTLTSLAWWYSGDGRSLVLEWIVGSWTKFSGSTNQCELYCRRVVVGRSWTIA